MIGGYGNQEHPEQHSDIVVIDRNAEDVPNALADCLFYLHPETRQRLERGPVARRGGSGTTLSG
jgi:hypothetical protein